MFIYRSDYNSIYARTVREHGEPLTESFLTAAHTRAQREATLTRADIGIGTRHSGRTWHDHGGGDCMCFESTCGSCLRGIDSGTGICRECWDANGDTSEVHFIDWVD